MDLRTRYTALVTLMTQYVKFASETLKRTEDEEVRDSYFLRLQLLMQQSLGALWLLKLANLALPSYVCMVPRYSVLHQHVLLPQFTPTVFSFLPLLTS